MAIIVILFILSATATKIFNHDACLTAGRYTMCQNLWGSGNAIGSQESSLIASDNSTISWSTEFYWVNNFYSVKSFANVESHTTKGLRLRQIQAIPTVWDWEYGARSPGLKANVAYDIWLGNATSGDPASSASSHEIMIWLSSTGGARPLGTLSASNIIINNHVWTLWKATRKNWEVFTFASAAGVIQNFRTDLNSFLTFLSSEQNISSDLYLHRIQAGTEPFVGSAHLITSQYSVSFSHP